MYYDSVYTSAGALFSLGRVLSRIVSTTDRAPRRSWFLSARLPAHYQTLRSPLFYHAEPAPQLKFPAIRSARMHLGVGGTLRSSSLLGFGDASLVPGGWTH